jgi:hypothetical protein
MLDDGNPRGTESRETLSAEMEALTIDNIDMLDRIRAREERDREIVQNLERLIATLGITPIAFWFTIYVISYLKDEAEWTSMMNYLYGRAHTPVIFTDKTFALLGRWRSTREHTEMLGTLNTETMSFIFMFHRA